MGVSRTELRRTRGKAYRYDLRRFASEMTTRGRQPRIFSQPKDHAVAIAFMFSGHSQRRRASCAAQISLCCAEISSEQETGLPESLILDSQIGVGQRRTKPVLFQPMIKVLWVAKSVAGAESIAWPRGSSEASDKILAMALLLRYFLGWLIGILRPRQDLILENFALRQQLLTLHAKRPRHRLRAIDKLFWVMLRRAWSGWRRSLILVTPETVVRWHRAGFRLYWAWISRRGPMVGRRPLRRELRDLVLRVVAENPTWGAPRIHGELLKLGFTISERTVSRWVRRARREPDPVVRQNPLRAQNQ